MKRFSILFLMLSLISLFILSCTSNWTKNNGSVATNDDIKAIFENHEYISEYNYYYTANYRYNSLQAIVGIREDYELVKESSGLYWTDWQQFEPSREKLKELVEALDNPTSTDSSTIGFIIFTPGGGDQIGIMYSVKWYSDIPEIRFKDRKLIVVKPRKFLTSSGAP